ncbi:MAG: hypothetical protein M3Q10_06595 [Chloroflexota bacterium]|nr:hypothetical protein [Chloroflexota bacterium]
MANLPGPSLARRAADHRREVVIALVVRRGPTWDAIKAVREQWRIEPVSAVPPELARGNYHGPPYGVGAGSALQEMSHLLDWHRCLKNLFVVVVPSDIQLGFAPLAPEHFPYRMVDPSWEARLRSGNPWLTFLSGCVLYDPPDTELERFADHSPFPIGGLGALPIVEVRDPIRAVEIERARCQHILDGLMEGIGVRFGDDVGDEVERLRAHLEVEVAPTVEALHKENTPRRYVDPLAPEADTIEDAERAIRALRPPLPHERRRRRPPRDRLRAVQCAIFRHTYGMTWSELARRYGWDTKPAKGRDREDRCDAAMDHARLGREVLGGGPTPRRRPPKTSPPPG